MLSRDRGEAGPLALELISRGVPISKRDADSVSPLLHFSVPIVFPGELLTQRSCRTKASWADWWCTRTAADPDIQPKP